MNYKTRGYKSLLLIKHKVFSYPSVNNNEIQGYLGLTHHPIVNVSVTTGLCSNAHNPVQPASSFSQHSLDLDSISLSPDLCTYSETPKSVQVIFRTTEENKKTVMQFSHRDKNTLDCWSPQSSDFSSWLGSLNFPDDYWAIFTKTKVDTVAVFKSQDCPPECKYP